jgi:hypothetical protein
MESINRLRMYRNVSWANQHKNHRNTVLIILYQALEFSLGSELVFAFLSGDGLFKLDSKKE